MFGELEDDGAAVGFKDGVEDGRDVLRLRLGLGLRGGRVEGGEELGADGDELGECLVHDAFENVGILAISVRKCK